MTNPTSCHGKFSGLIKESHVWEFGFAGHRSFRALPLTAKSLKNYVMPKGAVTVLELGSSNIVLKLLDVSFGTITKGAAPVFTMMWGLAFGIEAFSLKVLLSLDAISCSVVLAAFGEGSHFMLKLDKALEKHEGLSGASGRNP